MKRHFLLLLVALLPMVALTTFTSCSGDDDIMDVGTVKIDGIYYKFSENNAIVTYKYKNEKKGIESSYTGNIVIPEYVTFNGKSYRVTSINDNAFVRCSGLTTVTIPESVVSIGEFAFYKCSNLTSVNIPNSVTSISWATFYECCNLKSITIPNSVTSIGNGAFQGCSSLTSITIPHSVTSIGESAFYGCTGLTSVIIPDGVTSIEQSLFMNCTRLKNITIPNSVTTIGHSAFQGCTSLTLLTIPNNVTNLGRQIFMSCNNLEVIYCYATTPPIVNNYTFESESFVGNYHFIDIRLNITLYVPASSLEKYKADISWNKFKKIVAI